MDPILESPSVVIVGAGFSAAATGGSMPLMGNYFDRLQRCEYPLLFDYIERSHGDVATMNVEMMLHSLDQIEHADKSASGWADDLRDNAAEIRRELDRYTLNRISSALDTADETWATNLLHATSPVTTTISMNYDNIAERVLSD